ncbi:hypothetical protein V1517DRAFT_97326 [Lipomyces orientalis]|uniref:Uncharacterized protein n=1 Tax=Lipomyces orientalis TaxID=1233043 RepID=A0ACC3TC85_9ASCO
MPDHYSHNAQRGFPTPSNLRATVTLGALSSAPQVVESHANSSPEVAHPLTGSCGGAKSVHQEEKTSSQYLPEQPDRTKSRKKVWIISAIIVLVCVGVGLGVGLGIGLKSPEPPIPEPEPTPIKSNMSSKYCISESNVVKSSRFENIPDWTIINGIYHYEPISWNDSSPAGLFLPGLRNVYESYSANASSYQEISGLTPNKRYSLAYAFTAVTVTAAPGLWAWDTFNFTMLVSQEGIDITNARRQLHTSGTIDLDIHTTGISRTIAERPIDVYANSSGMIFVGFYGLGYGVDFYLYYVSIFDPENNTCDSVNNKPVFDTDALMRNYDSYRVDNVTIGETYCLPESNIIADPRFETIRVDVRLCAGGICGRVTGRSVVSIR